ncbi:gamma-glutamyl-gamma-aminobutyrate hydrolase family protein [Methylobacter sp.]|uniref:gamma-glutamyl-gamma-aminobutyrate hydrolase family protein n=1 Tax=Methylobacter sp. TaxID=2051955 RepID=UPI0025D5DE04|nr:gamma-glutamyl-gamma-aminobutyrate hydrolase family protein [Methylobacter sp.]
MAVSQRVDWLPERNERRDALDQNLCRWLVAAGYMPMPVPNVMGQMQGNNPSPMQNWLSATNPDAILLSGGNDIGDAPERDNTERCLLAYAEEKCLPVLGICRGMQMLSVWAGSTLQPVAGHVGTKHRLQGELTGDVNSFHRFAVAVCPPGFTVAATSEDGCIEAIRHETLPWQGWMWHPEREAVFQLADMQRLQVLFNRADSR